MAEKYRAAHAVMALLWARSVFARHDIQTLLHRYSDIETTDAISPSNVRYVKSVSKAINSVAGYLPWRSDCLVQAIAAAMMLRKRGIKGHITIGANMQDKDVFKSHAWLSCGDIVVTGETEVSFTPILTHSAVERDEPSWN